MSVASRKYFSPSETVLKLALILQPALGQPDTNPCQMPGAGWKVSMRV